MSSNVGGSRANQEKKAIDAQFNASTDDADPATPRGLGTLAKAGRRRSVGGALLQDSVTQAELAIAGIEPATKAQLAAAHRALIEGGLHQPSGSTTNVNRPLGAAFEPPARALRDVRARMCPEQLPDHAAKIKGGSFDGINKILNPINERMSPNNIVISDDKDNDNDGVRVLLLSIALNSGGIAAVLKAGGRYFKQDGSEVIVKKDKALKLEQE